ncbi:alginate export family protein [Panacagrimonas perspica]|nr:alginate export family protein [Panacagrimonas perspica]
MWICAWRGHAARDAARLLACAAALSPVLAWAADSAGQLGRNISGGKPNVELRVRSETVEQDSFDHDGEALTVRARVGYTTAKWNALDAQMEYEGARSIGSDEHYNSSENGHVDRPMVADPDFDELNQAWLRWTGLPQTTLKYGRQRIVFDNARFVGNVGWRQNETTFDAALLSTQLLPRTTLTYAWVSNVDSSRYFDLDPGPAVKLANDLNVGAHLVNASVAVVDRRLQLTGYGYLLDFHDAPVGPATRLYGDTQTYGLRATGAAPVQAMTVSYAAEFASQDGYADAVHSPSLHYSLLELVLVRGIFKATVGREQLDGDGAISFQTPLATAHMHQGWADQFLITPPGGLERCYVGLSANLRKLGLSLLLHDFESAKGNADYGDEVDVLVSYALVENLNLSAKLARYSADEYPVAGTPERTFDTTKSWVYAEYKF